MAMVYPVSRRFITLYRGALADIFMLFLKRKSMTGDYVKDFEERFTRFVGADYAIATSSGRSALYLLLSSLDLPPKTEIILPAYEDLSVPETIKLAGFIPVFVDIDPYTQNISFADLKDKITLKTSAIVVCHMFGNPVNIEEIRSFIRKDIYIIEDCAHAIGSKCQGRHVGTLGDAAFFSFFTTKPFMCFGGGGIITNSQSIYNKAKSKVESWQFPRNEQLIKEVILGYFLLFITSDIVFSFFIFPVLLLLHFLKIVPDNIYQKLRRKRSSGVINYKFTNLQAMIGIGNLKKLPTALAIRSRNALLFGEMIKKDISRPVFEHGCNYYFYVLFVKNRKVLQNDLFRRGVDTGKDLMRNCA
ncbi:MAG: aminotransferase class I/II-fold pyridoxal phosphate-dependent enzyme, partial [Candidatus Omnitrophota bacterium]